MLPSLIICIVSMILQGAIGVKPHVRTARNEISALLDVDIATSPTQTLTPSPTDTPTPSPTSTPTSSPTLSPTLSPTVSSTQEFCITGPKTDGGYKYGDIGKSNLSNLTAYDCQALCQSEDECGVWLYRAKPPGCWRKCAVGANCTKILNNATLRVNLGVGWKAGTKYCDERERRSVLTKQDNKCYTDGKFWDEYHECIYDNDTQTVTCSLQNTPPTRDRGNGIEHMCSQWFDEKCKPQGPKWCCENKRQENRTAGLKFGPGMKVEIQERSLNHDGTWQCDGCKPEYGGLKPQDWELGPNKRKVVGCADRGVSSESNENEEFYYALSDCNGISCVAEKVAKKSTDWECTRENEDRYAPDLGGCCQGLRECHKPRPTNDDYYCAIPNPNKNCWPNIVTCWKSC